MLSLKKIAVTGGIASGKTTVCHFLKKHGAYQVSADEIIHQLLEKNITCIREVVALLGSEIIVDGKINRKQVAAYVFSDTKKLQKLENLLHPLLIETIEKEYQKVKYDKRYCCFVVEFPLVQEIEQEKNFDFILAVVCDEVLAKQRFTENGFSPLDYEKRMKRQWKLADKAKQADFVIKNDGDLTRLENQVKAFIHPLT